MTTTPETTYIPVVAREIIRMFVMAEENTPGTVVSALGRALHTHAERLWAGGRGNWDERTADGRRAYVDDGYSFMALVDTLGFRANPGWGDWPCIVECAQVYDPKDATDDPFRLFIPMRLTYIEGSTYLAFYETLADLRADAWPAE